MSEAGVSLPLVVRNEFAIVEVDFVPGETRGGRLRITDLSGQGRIELDALELEGLTALGDSDRRRLGDPEWRMSDDRSGVEEILPEREANKGEES